MRSFADIVRQIQVDAEQVALGHTTVDTVSSIAADLREIADLLTEFKGFPHDLRAVFYPDVCNALLALATGGE